MSEGANKSRSQTAGKVRTFVGWEREERNMWAEGLKKNEFVISHCSGSGRQGNKNWNRNKECDLYLLENRKKNSVFSENIF